MTQIISITMRDLEVIAMNAAAAKKRMNVNDFARDAIVSAVRKVEEVAEFDTQPIQIEQEASNEPDGGIAERVDGRRAAGDGEDEQE